MRIVVDTNVIISGFYSVQGHPAHIVDMIYRGEVELFYNNMIYDEYKDVLCRPKFGFKKEGIIAFLEAVTTVGTFINNSLDFAVPKKVCEKIPEQDIPFAQVAYTAEAEYLITGNTKHFPKKIGQTKVVSPKEFMDLV